MSRICVKNIGKNCSEQQLREIFAQKGEITDVKIVRNHKNGLSRNFAFIGFLIVESWWLTKISVTYRHNTDTDGKLYKTFDFQNELQVGEAIRYFNYTFIGLSRIIVDAPRKLDDPALKEKKENSSENHTLNRRKVI